MKHSNQKKVVVGCTVILTATQKKCSVVKRQRMRERREGIGRVVRGGGEGVAGVCGDDADKYPEVEGERIVDDGFEFKALTCAPLKGRARAEEKIKDDYEGNFKCMLDLVRCSVIVETEEQLGGVLGKMLGLGIVVRLKNRFANPLPTGIGDCLMNVKVGGHICEV
ncbi:hypothetical protein TrLO_g12872 [Triparma laevis f. longispina]|uniref:Uncharacterized protein n=1 Tax=Triparma laevis f. longispina TaxID=1714387 RepID=A0A9W7FR60_9STRA|nr:hypothetical protein TrLO_g12872 [Triparma laevis f. longispina]